MGVQENIWIHILLIQRRIIVLGNILHDLKNYYGSCYVIFPIIRIDKIYLCIDIIASLFIHDL